MGDIARYFNRSEFACKCGCGADHVSLELVKRLDEVRSVLGRPLVVTSGVRCKKHNKEEGGKDDSAHLTGKAADIQTANSRERYEVLAAALRLHEFRRIGVAKGFIHLDVDSTQPQRVAWTY